MSNTIEVTDVGPVKNISVPVPEGGGVVVMIGPNGSGKTHVVNAVESLVSKTGRIVARDGAPRGEVSAFGATIRVARQMSRLGHLEVTSLEGRFSVADLVDPGFDDPAVADKHRTKALIQLTGVTEPDPVPFYDLVGGQANFDEYVSPVALKTDDVVTMAANIKREFERIARNLEQTSSNLYAQANTARGSAEGINVKAPSEETALNAAVEEAVVRKSRLEEQSKANAQAVKRQQDAQTELNKVQAGYTGPTAEAAAASLAEAQAILDSSNKRVAELEAELARAKEVQTKAKHLQELSDSAHTAAVAHEESVSGFRALAEAEINPPAVGLDEMEAVEKDVQTARDAANLGVLVRKAIADLEKAAKLKAQAAKVEGKGNTFREAAKSTDQVLSNMVGSLGCPLRVSGGRLVTDTDRGEELFAELSKGEQYKLAIGIAVKAVGPGGIIPLPQEAWEGLDPSNRQIVAAEVENTGVIILTAEATGDPELAAVTYDPFPLTPEPNAEVVQQ